MQYSIASIGDYVFRKCTSLTEVVIPGSVKSIGESAFMGCTRLVKTKIPEGYVLKSDAFKGCDVLETIVISETDIERLSKPGVFPKPLGQYNNKEEWQGSMAVNC